MTPLAVVYCLDTEGPLTEYPADTLARLIREHGLSAHVTGDPASLLADVQAGRHGARLADVAAPHRLAWFHAWDELTAMLADLTSADTRGKYADTAGGPLRISWFVIDLIGYRSNPRQRAQGQHAVWDRVSPFFGPQDSVGWHVHTLTPDRHPLAYGTSWTAVVHEHEASLCRRLLDKGQFPASFRAGGAIERNDLSHWLERFIPLDYSCLPGASTHGMDWRRPGGPYHPAWDDYRVPSDTSDEMRRTVVPCFDADSWACRLDTLPPVEPFCFATHDRKAIRPDLDRIVHLLNASGRPWYWTTASPPAPGPALLLGHDEPTLMTTETIFGEPFIAVDDGTQVYRVNARRESTWSWTYDRPPYVKRLAAAVTTPDGRTGVAREPPFA